ncbi:MAG TPA: MarR family transcriptional regulator [Pseudogracilibacillus sp.]|nr:MarR family transcriptional regulator [Pseudogracilibacillus sp.]
MQDKDTILAEVSLDIIRVANLLERLGGQYAQEGELGSVQQYMILSMSSFEESISMSDIRQNTLVTKQAVTGVVERMSERGYVKTYKDTEDRRVTRVCITSKGKKTLKTIFPKRVEGNRKAFSILSENEILQLSDIIAKLISNINP